MSSPFTPNMSQSPPNAAGQRVIQQISPQHAQQLFRHYQLEKDMAERSGLDTPEGKEHMEKAQKIKEILMKYNRRQQMLSAQAQRGGANPVAGVQQGSPAPGSQMGTPQMANTQLNNARAQSATNAGSPQQNVPGARPNMGPQTGQRQQSSPPMGSGTPPPQGQSQAIQDPQAKYQQVYTITEKFKAQLAVIQAKLNDPNTPSNEIAQYMQKERELSGKVEQCRRFAQQLTQQINMSQNQSRVGSQQPQGDVYSPQVMNPQQQALQQQRMMQQQQQQLQRQNSASSQQQRLSQPPQMQSPAMQQPMMGQMQMQMPMQQIAAQQGGVKPGVQKQAGIPPAKKQKVGTPAPGTPITSVNAAASKPVAGAGPAAGLGPMAGSVSSDSSRSRFQNMPIPEDLNIGSPQPVSIKQNNRPSILNGNSIGASSLTTPVLVRPQNFELEGERVLNRRKLKELVKSVGADEGDAEVTIDGDVEDLLLDLADEFITSVTSFACRLAKHRKSESIDVRDVQLHLERNWNIRIPGYSADDIRTVRKFIPTPSHNTKLNGISINKSVNKNQ
ncbi:hypothetical protein OGAPHI_003910 [Ogataea philodendri]|uniref:TBP-associated factor 12 n=1 Tax=Ogataea philodendri TaxID=1378263 RepID=A0A9P8P5N6_9ASCO|nr:uncharacterized protein OGAPHI_003910 [Ogataea philodendri]KAH3665722.1 hypothetical protein OGAPHI_003910 [Ogataea philodendri]